MDPHQEKSSTVIKWLDDFSLLVKKHGIFRIFVSLFFTVILIIISYLSFNPDKIISPIITAVENNLERTHREQLNHRISISSEVNVILATTLQELNANRVFVFEVHNGTANVNGLPYAYVNMVYEKTQPGTVSIINNYSQDLLIDRFPLISKTYIESEWRGTIEELNQEDPGLYHLVQNNNVDYLAMYTIHGLYYPIGFLGVSYANRDDIPSEQVFRAKLSVASQKISNLIGKYEK